jgi:hypothetical protein
MDKFTKALAAKGTSKLISRPSMWQEILYRKFISPTSIEDWIRNPKKLHKGGSNFLKARSQVTHLITKHLYWKIGNGERVRLGTNCWAGQGPSYKMSMHLVDALRNRNLLTLHQVVKDPRISPKAWITT